jgi:membrane protein
MSGVRALLARARRTHAYRAWDRYTGALGDVLAGGVAYLAFFSIIPALILGFAVFGFVLHSQPDLFERVVAAISDTLPGIVRDAGHPDGLIDASRPPTPNALTIAGAISLVTLLVAGLGWLSALRQGVRAVFGRPKLATGLLRGKLRDLLVMVTLGAAFVLSGALSTGVSSAARWLLEQLHIGTGSFAGGVLLRAAAVAVVFVIDVLLMLIVFRLLSGVRLGREDLLQGAVVGALGLAVLKLASGLLLASAAKKPVLGAFAVVVGLLVLLNLISRVILLAAAWAATTAQDRGRLAAPAPAAAAAPAVSRDAVLPTFGQRSADRTTLAAGAALGLGAALVVTTARRGVRAAVSAVRGR